MSPLFAELNRWSTLPFVWGETDCVMLAADWVRRLRGVDPAADLRLTYGSLGECQRLTRFFTDPVGCVAPRMAACGLRQTDAPRRGDVGIVQIVGSALRFHAAVCLGSDWAAPTQVEPGARAGIVTGRPPKIIAAWDVGYVE